jgi:FeS assembly SUF system protein
MVEELNPEPGFQIESGSGTSPVGGPIQEDVISVLRSCYDPEIPVDIYELGLVYGVEIGATGAVDIKMTLTSPSCPVAESLPLEVESKIRALPGVEKVGVEVVWDPPWTMENMSEAARLQLGLL